MNYSSIPEIKEVIDENNYFNKLVYEYLENLTYYNKKIIKNKIIEIYNEKQFKFKLSNIHINLLINKYRNNSIKFTKQYIFNSDKLNKGNTILREYSYFLLDTDKHEKRIACEYAI